MVKRISVDAGWCGMEKRAGGASGSLWTKSLSRDDQDLDSSQ